MDTRERIIRTALRIFLEKGYAGASLKEVASQAGVTKGGIYHYFQSKEELFAEAVAFLTEGMREWSAARFGSIDSTREMLAAILCSAKPMANAFAELVGEDRGTHAYSFVSVLLDAARRSEAVRRRMAAVYAETRANLERLLIDAQGRREIRSDIDCAGLALEINAFMEGILLLAHLDESLDLDAVGERVFRNLWTMIEA
ncbi:MAG: TetR/AcrR family transcriptional regulator [Candidatus Eisenbacteria bacterium]|nr:TetR/AcrR family transcriptional regulator [Candidatus Eisenbacteria bacterium]